MNLKSLFLITICSLSLQSTACASLQTEAATASKSKIRLNLSKQVLENRDLPFIEHNGPIETKFANALAMNVQYEPIANLKLQIEQALGLKNPLKIFTGWDKDGEAHITTLTPPEFDKYFVRDKTEIVTRHRINEIAREMRIQESDFEVLGLGRGEALINGKLEETYFVIVQSDNLLRIRRAIHAEFVENGGDTQAWDPENFFPHITIGYTNRDLHDSDRVFKDVDHSLDERFNLKVDHR